MKSHNGHLLCWAGNRTLYFVGKYNPFIWLEMCPAKKILADPLLKKIKKSAPLADPLFGVKKTPKKLADPLFGADPLLSGPFIWGGVTPCFDQFFRKIPGTHPIAEI